MYFPEIIPSLHNKGNVVSESLGWSDDSSSCSCSHRFCTLEISRCGQGCTVLRIIQSFSISIIGSCSKLVIQYVFIVTSNVHVFGRNRLSIHLAPHFSLGQNKRWVIVCHSCFIVMWGINSWVRFTLWQVPREKWSYSDEEIVCYFNLEWDCSDKKQDQLRTILVL